MRDTHCADPIDFREPPQTFVFEMETEWIFFKENATQRKPRGEVSLFT